MNEEIADALVINYTSGTEKTWEDVGKRLFEDDRIPLDMQKRLKDGFLKEFVFSTPVLTNMNTRKTIGKLNLPISCYIQDVEDKMSDIAFKLFESKMLASKGGGIAKGFNKVREIGSEIAEKGISSGVVPLMVEDNAMISVTSQGSRRGAESVTLGTDHLEIEEFINIKDNHTGNLKRKALELFPSVLVTDKFMEAKENLTNYDLTSRKTGEKLKELDAFNVWSKIMDSRSHIGVPYLAFHGNLNKNLSETYRRAHEAGDINIDKTNLCVEITLHNDEDMTSVCVLGSLNLANYDTYKDRLEQVIYDMQYYLEIVKQEALEVIARMNLVEQFAFKNVKKFLEYDGSIAIGWMGFTSYLQSKMIPFDSLSAKFINKNIAKAFQNANDKSNAELADVFGPAPMCEKYGLHLRFPNCSAIAPTGSISSIAKTDIARCVSPSIEPYISNYYTTKRSEGIFTIKNPYLFQWMYENLSEEEIEFVEDRLKLDNGSIKNVPDSIIPKDIKDVFKTVSEIDMQWVIEHAADRLPYIDQSQSLNIWLHVDTPKDYIDKLHTLAYNLGIKTMYYCRPLNGGAVSFGELKECLSCQ